MVNKKSNRLILWRGDKKTLEDMTGEKYEYIKPEEVEELDLMNSSGGRNCVVCPVENQDCDVCRMDEAMDDLETIIKFREYNNKIDSTQTANKRRRL